MSDVFAEEELLGGKVAGNGGGTASPDSKPAGTHTRDPTPDLSRDDLRAYAYEGDGSSSGSLTSTISGQSRAGEINMFYSSYQSN